MSGNGATSNLWEFLSFIEVMWISVMTVTYLGLTLKRENMYWLLKYLRVMSIYIAPQLLLLIVAAASGRKSYDLLTNTDHFMLHASTLALIVMSRMYWWPDINEYLSGLRGKNGDWK